MTAMMVLVTSPYQLTIVDKDYLTSVALVLRAHEYLFCLNYPPVKTLVLTAV